MLAVAACGPSGSAPRDDSCLTPSGGTVDTLALGAATPTDLAGGMTPFVALHDGDGVTLLRGGQGANMIGLVLSVSGASAPACLGQSTVVTDAATGSPITSSSPPLVTYAQPDGTRLSKPLWLPGAYPMSFVVTTTAANQSLTLHLHLLLTP